MDASVIELTYYYSACVGLRTPDVSLLCDPWFSEGIYDGAWYAFPPLERPLDRIGKYDSIYVSHIHPDHYDPVFLRAYRERYPQAEVVIAREGSPFLSRKLDADGIAHQRITRRTVGATEIGIFANQVGSNPVDTALVVRCGGHAVVNMNDNPYDPAQIDAIRDFVGESEIRIALLPYTGAGPYPQTYYDDESILRAKAEEKKQLFFDRYRRLRDALGARVNIPFAGQYLLGGSLAPLNPLRGVADATEVLAFDDTARVLADGGDAWIDTQDLRPSAQRTEPYARALVDEATARIASRPLDFEVDFAGLQIDSVPWRRLLPLAYAHALERSHCERPYLFSIRVGDDYFVFDANRKTGVCEFRSEPPDEVPRSEITIDFRYLFGLVTGVYHWNNAEVGSMFRVHRVPDRFDLEVQNFLNFFHI